MAAPNVIHDVMWIRCAAISSPLRPPKIELQIAAVRMGVDPSSATMTAHRRQVFGMNTPYATTSANQIRLWRLDATIVPTASALT